MLDSQLVVVAHSPASLAECRTISEVLSLHLIKETSSRIKLAGNLMLIIDMRCHHHQTTNLHVLNIFPLTLIKELAAGIER